MSRRSKSIILSLDIGTNYVKALVANETDEGGLEILSTSRVKQESGSMRAGIILDTSAVTETCRQAISEAEEKANATVKKVVLSIAGELVKSSVSRVHYRRSNKERIFSEEEFDAIINKIETTNEEKARKEIAFETDNPNVEAKLLDSAFISAKIDGKIVDDPIDCEGEDVIIEYYTAFASETYVSALENLCAELKLDLISISTEPYAIFRAIIGNENKKESAVILDIGGDNTNITVLEDGNLRGTEAFNIGTKSLVKDLSIWTSGLKIALSNIPHVIILPPKIILCGGGAESFELQEYLALGNWFEDVAFDRRPTVQILEKNDLPDIEGDFEVSFSTAVGLARIGLESQD